MSDDDITTGTHTVRSPRSTNAAARRKSASGPGKQDPDGAGRRPRRAPVRRRSRTRWSVRDRIGAALAATGGSAVVAIMALAAAGGPAAAYAAVGAIGAGATAAAGVYFRKD